MWEGDPLRVIFQIHPWCVERLETTLYQPGYFFFNRVVNEESIKVVIDNRFSPGTWTKLSGFLLNHLSASAGLSTINQYGFLDSTSSCVVDSTWSGWNSLVPDYSSSKPSTWARTCSINTEVDAVAQNYIHQLDTATTSKPFSHPWYPGSMQNGELCLWCTGGLLS